MTFWKRQNYGDSKKKKLQNAKISGCQGLQEWAGLGRDEQEENKRFLGQ